MKRLCAQKFISAQINSHWDEERPNAKRRVLPRAFLVLFRKTKGDQRTLATPSKRESQGLTIMPFTSLRNAAVSTTSENGWIDMTASSI